MTLKNAIVIFTAISGIIAAIMWYIASSAEVAHDPNREGDKSAVIFFNGDHQWDVIRTAELQTKWNKRAALFASIAAILQSLSLFLPEA